MVLECRKLENSNAHEAGRALLRQLYRAQTGQEMPPVLIAERGKPYFEGNPVYFSISHTRHHVFVVLSDVPVGIDAEEADRDVNLKLAEKILSPAEKAQFDAAADKRKALLTFWVLKEAHAKCIGEGLRGYPNRTNFSLDDPRVFEQDGCIVAVVKEEKFHVI